MRKQSHVHVHVFVLTFVLAFSFAVIAAPAPPVPKLFIAATRELPHAHWSTTLRCHNPLPLAATLRIPDPIGGFGCNGLGSSCSPISLPAFGDYVRLDTLLAVDFSPSAGSFFLVDSPNVAATAPFTCYTNVSFSDDITRNTYPVPTLLPVTQRLWADNVISTPPTRTLTLNVIAPTLPTDIIIGVATNTTLSTQRVHITQPVTQLPLGGFGDAVIGSVSLEPVVTPPVICSPNCSTDATTSPAVYAFMSETGSLGDSAVVRAFAPRNVLLPAAPQ